LRPASFANSPIGLNKINEEQAETEEFVASKDPDCRREPEVNKKITHQLFYDNNLQ
jgi:hypothetical protein